MHFSFKDQHMLRLVKLKKRTFYIMIISAAAVILSVSVDTLLRANNDLLFNEWIAGGSFEINDSEQLYRLYLSSLMADYFFRMIVPVAFGLQTYFAFIKSGVGIVYKIIWAVIIGAMLIVTLLNFDPSSPVYYITSAAYVIIVISLLRIKHNPQKSVGG